MSISVKLLNDQIKKISDTNSLLDMLIEFESVLDSLGLYAYENWIEGEILSGPILKRHWMEVSLVYPREAMPDPDGALRLMDRGCLVKYTKKDLIVPLRVKSYDDVEPKIRPDGQIRYRAKTQKEPIWVVTINMPRRYVDEFEADVASIMSDVENDAVESMTPTQTPDVGGGAAGGMDSMGGAMGGMMPPGQF